MAQAALARTIAAHLRNFSGQAGPYPILGMRRHLDVGAAVMGAYHAGGSSILENVVRVTLLHMLVVMPVLGGLIMPAARAQSSCSQLLAHINQLRANLNSQHIEAQRRLAAENLNNYVQAYNRACTGAASASGGAGIAAPSANPSVQAIGLGMGALGGLLNSLNRTDSLSGPVPERQADGQRRELAEEMRQLMLGTNRTAPDSAPSNRSGSSAAPDQSAWAREYSDERIERYCRTQPRFAQCVHSEKQRRELALNSASNERALQAARDRVRDELEAFDRGAQARQAQSAPAAGPVSRPALAGAPPRQPAPYLPASGALGAVLAPEDGPYYWDAAIPLEDCRRGEAHPGTIGGCINLGPAVDGSAQGSAAATGSGTGRPEGGVLSEAEFVHRCQQAGQDIATCRQAARARQAPSTGLGQGQGVMAAVRQQDGSGGAGRGSAAGDGARGAGRAGEDAPSPDGTDQAALGSTSVPRQPAGPGSAAGYEQALRTLEQQLRQAERDNRPDLAQAIREQIRVIRESQAQDSVGLQSMPGMIVLPRGPRQSDPPRGLDPNRSSISGPGSSGGGPSNSGSAR